ncbi:hypothetical protein BH09VER1_BH09VER1_08370 [soil metagenome]
MNAVPQTGSVEGVFFANASIPYQGIGTSITQSGEVNAPTHYDLLSWHPNREIDGTPLMDKDVSPEN